MLKLIIIFIFLYFSIRWVWRVISPIIPTPQAPIELKACEYYGILVRVDRGVVVNGCFYCSHDHANRKM